MVVPVGWVALVVFVDGMMAPGAVVGVVDGFMVVFVGVVVGGDMIEGRCGGLSGWSVGELVRWWCWRTENRLANCGNMSVKVRSDGPMNARSRVHSSKNFGLSL